MKPIMDWIRAAVCTAALALCCAAVVHAGIEGQGEQPAEPESDVKVWQVGVPLAWEDFQAPPPAGAFAAQTVWTWRVQNPAVISCVEDQDRGWSCTARQEQVVVQTLFLKGFSWVKSVARGSVGLLAHEQGHFDLAEVFARRAAQALRSLSASASADDRLQAENTALAQLEQQLTATIETWLQSAQAEQDRYDHQTQHGTARAQQSRWESSIQAQLAQAR